ncbi:YbaB/EbfC family nucleoid-associated protein [Actinomadura decatromicini]|uniref:YbaB/EbfC family nucleoid-associated protein n=1 Tax=Actinomadura decatromicini TaxID=2604572 RepID=A0A5D3F6F8_9ACTN|nr:YbaB/EbfC family nucleoid-associated protein [Actinomadura decatromicini]TYK43712.1 YbaB/EbfC family nucleoid-associated protein [Actinomadura decatromicini]
MAEFSLGPDFERYQRDMQQQMGDLTKMQESIKAAVGRGEAADGRIVAEYRSEGGLTKLDLDPRALRLPAVELSDAIRTAVNAAAQDFQTKVREASSSMFDLPDDPQKTMDPAKALASLDKIANGFAGQLRDLARELGVQQQRAQQAMENYKGPGSPGPR